MIENGSGPLERFGGPRLFLAQALARNEGILSEQEQGLLQAAHVLVAGCGSVGGAVVEPLARLGVGSLALADPDVYETHNLNRQACRLGDIGVAKPEVLAGRVEAINPLVAVEAFCDGITVGNVEAEVSRSTVIFDGIDPAGDSLWIKYLLHKHAAVWRVPVMLGADIGGKAAIFVYDYRRDRRPFYGRGEEAWFRNGSEMEAMRAMNRIQAVPADFFPVIESRIADERAWPQITYTAAGLGALAARLTVDLAVNRRVRHTVGVDLHLATRPLPGRIAGQLRWPFAALRALGAARRGQGGAAAAVGAITEDPPAGLSEEAMMVGDAIRRAPLFRAGAAWRLRPMDDGSLRLMVRGGVDATAEPGALGLSIGCALASARCVAKVEFRPAREGPEAVGDALDIGGLEIDGLREEGLVRALGLLRSQGPDRRFYARTPISSSILEQLSAGTPEARSSRFRLRTDRKAIWAASMVVADEVGVRPARRYRRCGALALLYGQEDDADAWIDAGEGLMGAWLRSRQYGLAMEAHVIAAADPATRERLLDVFGLDGAARPFALLRLGYIDGPPPLQSPAPLEQLFGA